MTRGNPSHHTTAAAGGGAGRRGAGPRAGPGVGGRRRAPSTAAALRQAGGPRRLRCARHPEVSGEAGRAGPGRAVVRGAMSAEPSSGEAAGPEPRGARGAGPAGIARPGGSGRLRGRPAWARLSGLRSPPRVSRPSRRGDAGGAPPRARGWARRGRAPAPGAAWDRGPSRSRRWAELRGAGPYGSGAPRCCALLFLCFYIFL